MSIGAGVFVPKGVDRVADGTPVGPGQPVGEGLALEAAHVVCVEILAQQVVGLQKNGYLVAREHVDEAESGRIADRPQFQRMLDEASKPEAPFK